MESLFIWIYSKTFIEVRKVNDHWTLHSIQVRPNISYSISLFYYFKHLTTIIYLTFLTILTIMFPQ